MAKALNKEFPLLEFVGIWLVILFGFLAVPDFSFVIRGIFILVGSVGVILFGLYYDYHLKIKKSKSPETTQPINNVINQTATKNNAKHERYHRSVIILYSVNAVLYFFLGIYDWQNFKIGNVPIFTYQDALCVFYITLGFLDLLIIAWVTRKW